MPELLPVQPRWFLDRRSVRHVVAACAQRVEAAADRASQVVFRDIRAQDAVIRRAQSIWWRKWVKAQDTSRSPRLEGPSPATGFPPAYEYAWPVLSSAGFTPSSVPVPGWYQRARRYTALVVPPILQFAGVAEGGG